MTDKTAVEAMAEGIAPKFGDFAPGLSKDMAQEFAQSALDALKANGFAVVPVEPTEVMIGAAESYMDNYIVMAEDIYRAMIAAAQGGE